MSNHKNTFPLGLAACAALSFSTPFSASAQSLDVTCTGLFSTCIQRDMSQIEDAVNQNGTDIADNAAAQATTDDNQDQALADAIADQAITDGNQDQALANAIADQATTDGDQDQALANAIADQAITDSNQDQALADAVADQAVTDAAQDVIIGENTQAAADAQATADGAVAVNVTQQAEIDANTTRSTDNAAAIVVLDGRVTANETAIQTNANNIATNTANIATNAADIVDLQNDLSDLRTDLNQGLAMANAMEVFAPDPGSNFRLNVGTGFHDGETAFGVTASGRVGASGGTIVYLGVAGSQDTAAGKAGVSFQW